MGFVVEGHLFNFKANELSQNMSLRLTVAIINGNDAPFIDDINKRADRVIHIEDDSLEDF